MHEYDYANARIRGLRGRLLRQKDLDALAGLPAVADVVAWLGRTDYAPEVEAAEEHASGVALVDEAARRNLERRVRAATRAFEAEAPGVPTSARRLVGVLVARYDLFNLVTILRARAAGSAPAAVLTALLPAGELGESQLARLAESRDVGRFVLEARRTGLPYLQDLVADRRGRELSQSVSGLETALRRAFLRWAEAQLERRGGQNTQIVREALALEVDASNLLIVLRLARAGVRVDRGTLASLLLPGGSIPVERIGVAPERASPLQALDSLRGSPFVRALAVRLTLGTLFDETADVEWATERYLGRWAEAQVFRDPLGIALALAYLAAKVSEARALRLLARGVAARWPRARLRSLLAAA